MPHRISRRVIVAVAAFLLAGLGGAYGGWILWDQEASGILIPIAAIALLLIGGILSFVSLFVGRVPLRRVVLVLVVAAVGLLVGYGLGPKREPLIQQFDGTLTLHLESPVVADATGPVYCANVASATEFAITGDGNTRLETPDRPFVSVFVNVGDRWEILRDVPRKDGVLLQIGITGALVTDPSGKPGTIGMQATESSTLESTFSNQGGSIRFANLAPQTGFDYNGDSLDLAGTIEWTCGPAPAAAPSAAAPSAAAPSAAAPSAAAPATLAPESSGTLATPAPRDPSDAATATPRATLPPKPAPTYSASLVWQGGYLPSLQAAFSGNAAARDVIVGGPGFVIVGSDANARGEVGASWTSANGVDWQEHDSGIAVASGRVPFESVAAGGGALVAVGSLGIWRSTDGATWDRVGDASMLGTFRVDVAWGPAGFVATGWGDGTDARIWRSANGISWEQAPPVGSLVGFCPARISGSPDGYQVLGSPCGASPSVVLASADGLSWTPAQGSRWITMAAYLKPVAAPRTTCGGTATAPQMNDVGAFGPGYVAVGISRCGNDEQGAAWTSPDGASWQISEIPTSFAKWPMRALAVRNGKMIVVAGTPWPDYFPAVFTVGLGK